MSVTNVTVSETTYKVTGAETNQNVTVSPGDAINVAVNSFTISSGIINTGTGAEVGKGIVGDNLQLRKLKNGDNNITITQNTDDITIDFASPLAITTTDITEGTNLYYTDARNDSRTRAYLQGVHNADIYPDTDGTRNLGASSRQYNIVYSEHFEAGAGDTRLTDGILRSNQNLELRTGGDGSSQTLFLKSPNTQVTGNIVPSANVTYDLGSTTHAWRDIYVGPGSLYVDGQKVVSSDEGTIDITTDPNQNLTIQPGADLTLNVSAPATLSLDSSDIHIGNATNDSAIDIKGSLEVLGPNINRGATELTDGMLNVSGISQNGEIRAGGYLHPNVSNYSVGTLSQAAHITGTEFKHIGERLDITGELYGAVEFTAKNTQGATISKGQAVYIKGHSGNDPEIGLADANASATMPAFGIATEDITNNTKGDIVTFGELRGFDTSAYAVGDELFVSETAGNLTNTRPSATATQVQKVAKVIRSHAVNGILFVMGAGRTNDIPNLATGEVFIGDGSGYETRALDTSDVAEDSSNLYYTDARADARIAAADTDDLSEGTTNLYFTNERVDDRVNALLTAGSNITLTYDDTANTLTIASTDTEDDLSNNTTDDLSEGTTNLYYTDARARASISASGSLSYNSTTGVISYTQPTNVSTFTNDSGYLTDITGENLRDLADVSGSNSYGHVLIGTGSGYAIMQGTTELLTEGTNKFFTAARAISAI